MRALIPIVSLFVFSGLLIKEHRQVRAEKVENIDIAGLQDGDLVLRNGKGLISDMFRNTSPGRKEFSHAGMLVNVNNEWFVVHVIGSEFALATDFKMEPLSRFCDSKFNYKAAIYRYDLTDVERTAVRKSLLNSLNKPVKFDRQFDLNTDSAMYCSEYIYKTLVHATHDLNYIHTVANGNQKLIPLDALYDNSHARLIREIPLKTI